MKYTTNYNLKKPEGSDTIDIDDINSNMDTLDAEIKTVSNSIPSVPVQSVNTKTGAVTLSASDVGAEPSITKTNKTTDFWSGAKTFRDLATDVRAVALTGLSTATNAVISTADSILSALGKLQSQITSHEADNTAHGIGKYETDMQSQANGKGASMVGIEDANGNFSSGNVEGALSEIMGDMAIGIKANKTYTYANGSPAGWYRMASGAHCNALLMISETAYDESENLIWIGSKYCNGSTSPTITVLGRNNYSSHITKLRLMIDGSNWYLDAYMNAANPDHQITLKVLTTGITIVDSFAIADETSKSTATTIDFTKSGMGTSRNMTVGESLYFGANQSSLAGMIASAMSPSSYVGDNVQYQVYS